MLPPSPLLVWGRQYSRADQDWGGGGRGDGSGSLKRKRKKKTLWSWNHLAILALPLTASPRAVLQEPRLSGL